MSIYDRKNFNSRSSYYNDYFLNDSSTPKRDTYLWFLIFITVTVFFLGIINIVFSYMDIDKCQKLEYITSLNIWIRFLGVCSIIYYIFLFLCIYFIYIRNTQNAFNDKVNYERMYNNYERSDQETNSHFFKVFVSIFTIFILIIQGLITYSYFQYFNNHCISYTIIVYIWTSLIVGILSSLFIIFSVFFFSFD